MLVIIMKTTLFLLLILLIGLDAYASPGDLDITFNPPNGFQLYTGQEDLPASGRAVAIQSDGKLLVTGSAFNAPAFMDLVLLRYNTDGSLDATFGNKGVATFRHTVVSQFWSGGWSEGEAIVIQPDGKIVIAGEVYGGSSDDVLLLRFNSDGTLDPNFGTEGVVIFDGPEGRGDYGYGVALESDGKIVVAGYSNTSQGSEVLVLRYNPTGIPDSTFGVGGVVTYFSQDADLGNAVAIQQDGKILVNAQTFYGLKILRCNNDGKLDSTFGSGGIVSRIGDIAPRKMVLQSNGEIVVGGVIVTSNGTKNGVLVLRFNTDGTPDNSFGTGGPAIYASPIGNNAGAQSVAIQQDGKIVVTGYILNSGSNFDILVVRFTRLGLPDTNFGIGGAVSFDGPTGSSDEARGLAIQSDGKIVIVGTSANGATNDLITLRLIGGEIIPVSVPATTHRAP